MANYFKGFVLLSAVVLLGAGCSQATQPIVQPPLEKTPVNVVATSETKPELQTPEAQQKETAPLVHKTVSANISNFAFVPAVIKIKVGDTVVWTNNDAAPHQVASNPHPTHTDLPGLLSGVLSNGQSYSYTFDKAGTWGYHCHIHPSMAGTVVVQ